MLDSLPPVRAVRWDRAWREVTLTLLLGGDAKLDESFVAREYAIEKVGAVMQCPVAWQAVQLLHPSLYDTWYGRLVVQGFATEAGRTLLLSGVVARRG